MSIFNSTKKQIKSSMINQGILTTKQPLNNSQRLAYWYYKQGNIKHIQQREIYLL